MTAWLCIRMSRCTSLDFVIQGGTFGYRYMRTHEYACLYVRTYTQPSLFLEFVKKTQEGPGMPDAARIRKHAVSQPQSRYISFGK
jgi:hypothetical protein